MPSLGRILRVFGLMTSSKDKVRIRLSRVVYVGSTNSSGAVRSASRRLTDTVSTRS